MAVGEKTKYGKILAEWTVPEYIKHERSLLWYIIAGVVAAGLFIHAIVTINFLFAIIVLIVSSIVYLHERRHPDMLEFLIVETGIVLGETYYSFKELNSFWIVYEPPAVTLLYFGFNRTLRRELPIDLKDQNPITIRKILLKYLEEDLDKEEEATEESLGRLLKI